MLKRCSSCFHEFKDSFRVCPKCGYEDGDPAKELFYLRPGTMLANRYLIGKGIGHGGFGITYLAWDTKFDVKVAIKEYYWNGVVNRVPGTNEVIVFAKKKKKIFTVNFNRFIDEARNMAQFSSHKNIVNVFEYFEENGTAYIVMEYLSGCELEKHLEKSGGTLHYEEVLHISEMVCTALKDLHRKNIIHRDIAPDNIIIEEDGNAKLIDFGAARFSSDDGLIKRDVVKPGYSPLEQYNETSPQGPWSDIYSLGAMMYKLLTGVKPEEATDRNRKDTLQPPKALNSEIPEYLSNAIVRAMAMDSFLRFQSVAEMEKGLFLKKKVRTPEEERRRRKRKRMLTIAGCGVAACSIAAVLALRFFTQYVLPAEISVWYVYDESDSLSSSKKNGLETVIEDYKELYPQVKVNLIPVSANEYEGKLEEAFASDKAPDLFESGDIDVSFYEKCESLAAITKDSAADGCYFLEKYEVIYPDAKKMPIGFNIPVVYVNQSLCGTDYTMFSPQTASINNGTLTVVDTSDGSEYVFENITVTIQKDCEKAFTALYPDTEYILSEDDTSLYQREASVYFGTSESYLPVIFSLPGQITALNVSAESRAKGVPCSFDYEWSIYSNGDSKEKAARKLLAYMLSENAQEVLMVRNQHNAIPLQEHVMKSYSVVYEGIFSSVTEEIPHYIFETEG